MIATRVVDMASFFYEYAYINSQSQRADCWLACELWTLYLILCGTVITHIELKEDVALDWALWALKSICSEMNKIGKMFYK